MARLHRPGGVVGVFLPPLQERDLGVLRCTQRPTRLGMPAWGKSRTVASSPKFLVARTRPSAREEGDGVHSRPCPVTSAPVETSDLKRICLRHAGVARSAVVSTLRQDSTAGRNRASGAAPSVLPTQPLRRRGRASRLGTRPASSRPAPDAAAGEPARHGLNGSAAGHHHPTSSAKPPIAIRFMSKGIAAFMASGCMRGSFITAAFTLSRWARDR